VTPDRAAAILARRNARREAMLGSLLPEQRRAIEDPSLLKAFFCTRRAGKTWAIGTALFLAALAFAGCSCLYLGLTKDTSRRILNKDVMRIINAHFGIGARWHDRDHCWILPNESRIYLQGADANSYEIAKVVGQKYRVAVLDEVSKFRHDVHAMVYGALMPAMGDDLGTIILSGTPSNITAGLFYDVTTGAAGGWSMHQWTWRENIFKRDNIRRLHDELVAANPLIVTTPLYRQEWLGQWVVDTSALVYRFREDKNTIDALPKPRHEYTYILGVDLGFTDPSALVVGAYHEHDPALYVVYAVKRAGLIISDVADLIRGLWYQPSMGFRGPFPFAAMVADASQLQGVEEMRQHHHLPLEAAEKPGKRGVIEVMNSDLQTARMKLLPEARWDDPKNPDLVGEWGSLIWDEKKLAALPKRWEEDPRFPNHLADACLYMWRKARNYDALPEAPKAPAPFTPEWEAARHEREIAKIERLQREGGVIVDEMPPWMGGDV
jgi:hypothetical protein